MQSTCWWWCADQLASQKEKQEKRREEKTRTEKENEKRGESHHSFAPAVEVAGHCDGLLWVVPDPAVDCQAEQLCQLSVLLAGPHPHAGIYLYLPE